MTRGEQQTVGIIGGGALGLGAALRLAEAGRLVVVLEREGQLGGLAAGFRPGGDSVATLEKFYHHIFKTDRTIVRYIDALGLSPKLLWQQVKTSSLRDGHPYEMSATGVLGFTPIPMIDRVRFGATVAALKLMPNERLFRGQTAVRWSRRWFGDRSYEALIDPILRGKFGAKADDIAMSWLWSRFHERSLRLGYLRGGFQQLYDAMGARIRSLGGEIRLGVTARALRSVDGAVQVETDGGIETFSRLLVTAPQRVFQQIAGGLPEQFQQRHPGPDFFSAHVLILALDRPLTQQYWISVGDPGYPFLVVVEHTNFLPPSDYGGRHLVYLGNYLPPDAPLFRQSKPEVLAAFLPALRRLNRDFEPSWVRESWMFQAPFAQPIVTGRYLDTLPPTRTPVPGVFLATMAHVYPQDRGQNYSLALGERMAERILRS